MPIFSGRGGRFGPDYQGGGFFNSQAGRQQNNPWAMNSGVPAGFGNGYGPGIDMSQQARQAAIQSRGGGGYDQQAIDADPQGYQDHMKAKREYDRQQQNQAAGVGPVRPNIQQPAPVQPAAQEGRLAVGEPPRLPQMTAVSQLQTRGQTQAPAQEGLAAAMVGPAPRGSANMQRFQQKNNAIQAKVGAIRAATPDDARNGLMAKQIQAGQRMWGGAAAKAGIDLGARFEKYHGYKPEGLNAAGYDNYRKNVKAIRNTPTFGSRT